MKFIATVLVSIVAFTSGVSAQVNSKPWYDPGYAFSSTSYTPVLEVQGTPIRGRLVSLTVKNAAPDESGVLYLGAPVYGALQGNIVVPDQAAPIPFQTDATGGGSYAFVWPYNQPGITLGMQVVITNSTGALSASNALVGTTLSVPEALAYNQGMAAAARWKDIELQSVATILTINDVTRPIALDLIVATGALPQVSGGWFGVDIIPSFPIPQDEIDKYTETLGFSMATGNHLIEVVFKEPTTGAFSTYSIVDAATSSINANSFMELFPAYWPDALEESLGNLGPESGGSGDEEDPPSSGRWFSTHPIFGYEHWSATASVVRTCTGDQVNVCSADAEPDSGPLWDATIVVASAEISASGDCCVVRVVIAATSGFKKVTIEGGGIEISGFLGFSLGPTTKTLVKCCPE